MDNKSSKKPTNTGSKYNTEQISDSTKGVDARRRVNIKMVQNVLLIWLDTNINIKNEDCSNTVTQLRHVVNDIITFTDGEDCIEFTDTINDNKVCMIISGSLGQQIVPRVHNMFQVDSIFIFCRNKNHHEQWTKEWPKIKGVFTEITPICEALKQASQQCDQNAISISFVPTSGDASSKNLDRLDPMFMYTQIMKEILLTITFEQQHFKGYIDYCRDIFDDNEKELKRVDKLERNYRNETPVWWYTCQCFLYPMLNRALRISDMDIIIKMGFFIGDLHRQIEELHKEQSVGHTAGKILTVYRGQGLSKADFQKIKETKDGLMSFNNFLSTSKDRAVSLAFAESNQSNPDLVGILFVMTIDPSKSTTQFASINGISYFPEEDEILFSMHTVFRINDIKSVGENQRLIQVDLTLTGENDDKDLRKLTDHIREETFPGCEGWYRLGWTLYKMGQFKKSQQVYEVLLEQATNESDKACFYGQLGLIKDDQGEYEEAIILYEKALEIFKKTLPPNHPNLTNSYNNIGAVYRNMSEYSKALSSYEKALEIRQQSLPSNHLSLAASYNNIAIVYEDMGEYSKALSSHEKALEIKQQSLPSNHPDLAKSYIAHGLVYNKMEEQSKAIKFYEKAIKIQQESLPPNHPDLASSYNNIGNVYEDMGEYSKALSSYEEALETQQQSLPSNHPSLAMSCCNIGLLYEKKSEYLKARSFFERAVNIGQQSLPSHHPHLQIYRNNLEDIKKKCNNYLFLS
jgi:tetratricopeptide (TPR) repeat protein